MLSTNAEALTVQYHKMRRVNRFVSLRRVDEGFVEEVASAPFSKRWEDLAWYSRRGRSFSEEKTAWEKIQAQSLLWGWGGTIFPCGLGRARECNVR